MCDESYVAWLLRNGETHLLGKGSILLSLTSKHSTNIPIGGSTSHHYKLCMWPQNIKYGKIHEILACVLTLTLLQIYIPPRQNSSLPTSRLILSLFAQFSSSEYQESAIEQMNDWWLLAIKVFTCNNELQGHGYNLSIRLLGVIASGSLIQVSSVHQVFNYKVHWIIAKLCHSILQGRFLYIHPAGCPLEFFTVYFVQLIYVSCPVGTSSVQNKLKIIWNNDRSVTMQIQPYSKCDILLKGCLSNKKIYRCTACLADLWTVMQEKGFWHLEVNIL